MMGWLIALGILILLGILPLGVSVVYNAHGLILRLITGPVRLILFPGKKKAKKPTKEKTAEPNKGKNSRVQKHAEKSAGSIKDFLPLVRIVLDLLTDFRNKLRVDRLEMKLILAGGDPCDLSVNYGKAWIALGNLIPQLERFVHIKKRNLEIECDYVSNETVVFARLDLTITLGRLLHIGAWHGARALIELLKIQKLRKGGAIK